jgi:iron complex outermembrane receptor protein
MPQSFIHTTEEGIGYSYTGDWGSIGISGRHFISNYGIPGDPVDTAQTNPGPTSSRIQQEKYSSELQAVFNMNGSFIHQVRLNANVTDYLHAEYPTILQPDFSVTDSEQNSFHQNGYNARLQFIEEQMGAWSGSLGLWTDFENMTMGGPQPLGPNSLTSDIAGYVLEEYRAAEHTRIQGAVRYDYNSISTFDQVGSPVEQFQHFDISKTAGAVTGSLGIIHNLSDEMSLALNVGRSFRAPTVQELYAKGPDDASQSSMLGDSALVPETSIGIDLRLSGHYSNVTFSFSPFLNLITNYIYSYNTGILDTLNDPQYNFRQFAQTDARLFGAEASVAMALSERWSIAASADYVQSEDTKNNVPLPSTPPLRGMLKLKYIDNTYEGLIEWRLADAQNRLGDGDFATAGYGVVNLGFGVRLSSGEVNHNISLHADNILDQRYYNNLSAIGFFLPQPGRGFRLSYDVLF